MSGKGGNSYQDNLYRSKNVEKWNEKLLEKNSKIKKKMFTCSKTMYKWKIPKKEKV